MTPFGGDPDTNLHLIRAQWERTLEEVALGRRAPAPAHDELHAYRRGRLSRLGRTIVAHTAARTPHVPASPRAAGPQAVAPARPILVCPEVREGAYHTGECFSCE